LKDQHASAMPFEDDVIETLWEYHDGTYSEPVPIEPPPAKPGVSVVICTYKRPRSVDRFLASLEGQEFRTSALIVVDASPDAQTEQVLRDRIDRGTSAQSVTYLRVAGPLAGLTRQRNVGIRFVGTDLVAFFDDDIFLEPGCLREMERLYRRAGEPPAGVGAMLGGDESGPNQLWRLRRWLRLIPDLRPGTYHRSGISTPWSFLDPATATAEGDWLPGCAMMWRTTVVRDVGFYEGFAGYAQGEDLEFSLRARVRGKLIVTREARLQHLHDSSGRPDHFRLGYMAIHNRYLIHRRGLADRTRGDVAWFVYAWTVDSLLLLRLLLRPGGAKSAALQLAGRFRAAWDLIRRGAIPPESLS
jgi:GT2 family glycosyltransferase